jgi:hypothetical protein
MGNYYWVVVLEKTRAALHPPNPEPVFIKC